MSRFANNIEAMGFDKSGWALIEISADGNTTYMGKPITPDAEENEPVWTIKRIQTLTGKDGSQQIKNEYAYPKGSAKWIEKENLDYKYF